MSRPPPKTPQPARIVAVAAGHLSVRTDSGQYVDVLRMYVDTDVRVTVGSGGILAYGRTLGGFGFWLIAAPQ